MNFIVHNIYKAIGDVFKQFVVIFLLQVYSIIIVDMLYESKLY